MNAGERPDFFTDGSRQELGNKRGRLRKYKMNGLQPLVSCCNGSHVNQPPAANLCDLLSSTMLYRYNGYNRLMGEQATGSSLCWVFFSDMYILLSSCRGRETAGEQRARSLCMQPVLHTQHLCYKREISYSR